MSYSNEITVIYGSNSKIREKDKIKIDRWSIDPVISYRIAYGIPS